MSLKSLEDNTTFLESARLTLLPETTSYPSSILAIKNCISFGSYWRSESIMTILFPFASSKPCSSAPGFPAFFLKLMTCVCLFCFAISVNIFSLSSIEPSLTKMISYGLPKVVIAPSSSSKKASKLGPSLYSGTTTEISVFGFNT